MVAVPSGERRPSAIAARLPAWLTSDLGRVMDLAVVLLVLAWLIVLMPGLALWPPVINDEGREANLFWVASGADPHAERMNAYRGFATWGNGGLQGATTAVIFRLFGLGVFQARLTSLIWGGLLLLVVYWLGRRYWNRSVGLAATVLLAVSNPFMVSTHTLRPDVQVVTMVLGALLLAERSLDAGRRRPLVWAFLAGLVLGLVEDTHLNGAAFFPLVGLVYPLRQGWRTFLRRREAWVFAGGILAAAAYYLAVRFLPDPGGFIAALGYWVGVDKAPPAIRESGGTLAKLGVMLTNEVLRYQDYFGEEPLELAVVLLGLLGGLVMAVRGSHPARLFWLGLVFAFLFFTVAVAMKSKYYMLLTFPYYLLLLARVLERTAIWIAARSAGRHAHAIGTALLTLFVMSVMIWPFKLDDRVWDNYVHARRYREGQEYLQLTARLDQLAGPGARILAPPLYWIGLHDHPFSDIYVYERVERQYGMSPAQYLDEIRPDFVITDAKIATERRVERLLYNELDRRATYELVVRHKNYGDVAVYRLSWLGADGRATDHDRYGAGPAEAASAVGGDAQQYPSTAHAPAADTTGEADPARHP
jgi:4-amino-4-deoxy-L-arabinose transferase-like glycosyltransferase